MALQFDSQAGIDLSSLSSVTQAQIMQAINQIAPLSNIGGVILQPGTSAAATILQNTAGSPDVTNNARFARYIWLNSFNNPPTPYYYNSGTSNWTSTSIAALSITNAEISATAAIAVTKLAFGTARFLVRTNAAGTALEFVNPNSIFTNDDVPLTALDDTAASGTESFLRRVAGTAIWKTFAETVTAIQNALVGVPVTVLAPGSNNTLLGTGSAGVVAMDTPDNLIANLGLGLAKLAQGGASTKQMIAWNGSSWAPLTPAFLTQMAPFTMTATELINGTAAAAGSFPATGFNCTYRYAHGLSGVPRNLRVVAIQTGVPTVGGYPTNEEIDAQSLQTVTSAFPALIVSYDSINISVMIYGNNAGIRCHQKDTPGTLYTLTTADAAVWKVKLYAAI